MPASTIPELLQDLPIPKLRQLGGKFGEEVSTLTMLTRVHSSCKAASYHFEGVWGSTGSMTEVPNGGQSHSDNMFGEKQPVAREGSLMRVLRAAQLPKTAGTLTWPSVMDLHHLRARECAETVLPQPDAHSMLTGCQHDAQVKRCQGTWCKAAAPFGGDGV